MDQDVLKKRTKQFALRVIHLTESLPASKTADVIGRQLLRSGTSVAANYRAACRAKSPADFIAKMGIVEESLLQPLMQEANELLAITVASINTAKKRKTKE